MSENAFTRRDFLRVAAGGAALAATGVTCGSGSDKPKSSGAAAEGGASKGDRTLRIAQWSHFVPAYDEWFDSEYARRWGEENGVDVVVDHLPVLDVAGRGAAEAEAQSGHDLFGFVFPFSRFEDQGIDHREIFEEVEAKVGPMAPFLERSVFNPKTKKYFGFPDYWVANLAHYRVDLWEEVEPGLRPNTWDDVLRAGPKLKAMGYPMGLSVGEGASDSNPGLMALMNAYGSSIQDEEANVTINSPDTVEAVKMMTAIYKAGMTEEVLTWTSDSNIRFLATGTGSLILNPISAIRTVEKQNAELARRVELLPVPAGPAGRRGPHLVNTYVIWKFARNPAAAKQFLVDLALNSREKLARSEYYNLPSFGGAVPDLRTIVASDTRAEPPGKYAVLIDADTWTTNVGHPGYSNAAVDEVFEQFLVPKMFAAAARGEMSAEEAVAAAEAQIKPIFEKWRERGKI